MQVSRPVYNVVSNFVTAVTFSLLLTFFSQLIKSGLTPDFLKVWLKNFEISVLISIPTSQVLVPVVKNGLAKVLHPPPEPGA